MPERRIHTTETTYDFLTDEELFEQFHQKNNHKAFELIYQRYAHLMYGVCMKYLQNQEDSKDVMMGVMEQLISTPPTDSIQFFSSFIYKLTKNKCLDFLKKQGKQAELMSNWSINKTFFADFMESENLNRLNKERVGQAIKKLKPEQQACIKLFYLQSFTYQEIVTATGFNLNQVKSHLQNGKRKLTQLISKF